ncbi:type 1 glutamine amidotransferase domain-containing protein [Tunturiibacter psychrotolerans]|uniref:type 1 glutamine amidotransferase domain-containing protein n=1 Tax=Tunturiibacter psychrotolerans TaxID=3069686 RepID=UPI003D210EC7
MKVLFIATSVEKGLWLAELTHPYWHLIERGVEVDFASPKGGKISWYSISDPYAENSQEADDIVSKGFLSDKRLVAKTETTLSLASLDLKSYDAVHVAGGGGAAVDLYPSPEVAKTLEHFFSEGKVVGALCHGAIALGNNPDRIRGREVTGYSLAEDLELEKYFGKNFLPNYPQPILEKAGAHFTAAEPNGLRVVVDGKLITGQSQFSASEYSIVFHHLLTGQSPVHGSIAA